MPVPHPEPQKGTVGTTLQLPLAQEGTTGPSIPSYTRLPAARSTWRASASARIRQLRVTVRTVNRYPSTSQTTPPVPSSKRRVRLKAGPAGSLSVSLTTWTCVTKARTATSLLRLAMHRKSSQYEATGSVTLASTDGSGISRNAARAGWFCGPFPVSDWGPNISSKQPAHESDN